MTRTARRRRDRVTVEELLRETGAMPRKLGAPGTGRAAARAAAERPPREPASSRDREAAARERRVEERLRQAEGGSGWIGSRGRRRVLFSGAGLMLGGLVLLVLVSGTSDPSQATLPFVPLKPATTSPPAPLGAGPPPPVVSSATPSPVVMSATQTQPKVVVTDAPVVTATLPPPTTATTPPGRTTITLPDPYDGSYGGSSGGGHHHH